MRLNKLILLAGMILLSVRNMFDKATAVYLTSRTTGLSRPPRVTTLSDVISPLASA